MLNGKERKAIVDSMQKTVNTVNDLKKDFDNRIKKLETNSRTMMGELNI